MKAGYRYKRKRSLRTITTKFVHHKQTAVATTKRKTHTRKRNKRSKQKKRKTQKKRRKQKK